jgi:hypothetical protein
MNAINYKKERQHYNFFKHFVLLGVVFQNKSLLLILIYVKKNIGLGRSINCVFLSQTSFGLKFTSKRIFNTLKVQRIVF